MLTTELLAFLLFIVIKRVMIYAIQERIKLLVTLVKQWTRNIYLIERILFCKIINTSPLWKMMNVNQKKLH